MRAGLAASLMVLGACVAAPAAAQSAAGPARSLRNANYTIDVRLDPERHVLDATERIVWRNVTTAATSELRFHLYWNAWLNEKSTWLRERALTSPVSPPGTSGGAIDITSLTVTAAGRTADLTSSITYIAPDDDNVDDRTVMKIALPAPVAPGESIEVDVAWTGAVPRPYARTGYVGDWYFIAQWFPKLGVLEAEGWNCHQFHLSTEFFSDYGVYDVRMTVPRGWMLGATGLEQDRRDNGDGTTTHRYVQEDVHDFAWTTSPEFREHRRRFEESGLPAVDMRLLLLPEHEAQADRHFAAAASGLRRFGQWFGAYPYGHLTIVDPAYRSEAEGMEYPTLITAGTRWLIPRDITYNTPEEVVVHEAGHQFWYGLVGTNEFEHAWMDEGITTWATARAMAEDFPTAFHEARYFGGFVPWVFRDLPLRRETFWNRLAGYRRDAESDPLSRPAYRFYPPTGRSMTYNKTALWLNTLEREIGWPSLQRGLASLFRAGTLGHPAPQDFVRAIEDAAGRDLTPFFNEVIDSSNTFDYGIDQFSSRRESDSRDYRTTVVVRRYGEAGFPIEVVTRFADGEEVREQWDGRDRWREFIYVRQARAVSTEADPRRTLLLDIDRTNNSRALSPATAAAATKWSLKWMVWLQDALLTWGFLA